MSFGAGDELSVLTYFEAKVENKRYVLGYSSKIVFLTNDGTLNIWDILSDTLN